MPTQLLDYITGPVLKFCSYVETVQLRSFNAPTKLAVMKVTTLALSSNLQKNKQGDVKKKKRKGTVTHNFNHSHHSNQQKDLYPH